MSRVRWDFDLVDGPWRQRVRHHAPDDSVTVETVSTIDQAVAEGVRALQNADHRPHGLGSFAGDWHAIPPGVFYAACREDPELTSPDTATRNNALARWCRGPWRVFKVQRPKYVQGGLVA